MTKAPDAFRTISEVAAELDLPQHVLRFWESRFPQIKPMKRGGGRRYYRPDDVELLRGIRHLLYGQGYTIRGVQRILREQGPRFVQSVWQEGAPQPEPAAEQDLGEAEADGAFADIAAAVPPLAVSAEPEAACIPTTEPLLSPEPERREPAFAPIVPGESSEAVEAPIQFPSAGAAGNGHGQSAAPERGMGLPDADRERLAAVLEGLDDCRRLLDDALADIDPDP